MPISSARTSTARACALCASLLFAIPLPSAAQKGGIIDPPPIMAGLQVTFLIYSGLDNPTFTLTDPGQVADLQDRIENVRAGGAPLNGDAPEPVLGYNGIMIEDLGNEAEDAIFYVVKDGLLRVDGGNPEDPAARSINSAADATEIENLLISLGIASGAIDEATLSEIRFPR
ncbi:MAG TPA: hypothetical protein VGS22_00815 [Thermoanaerobaculia bacterium]|nr:hypothetical protein [Thermoanaerobaculia bacterium]